MNDYGYNICTYGFNNEIMIKYLDVVYRILVLLSLTYISVALYSIEIDSWVISMNVDRIADQLKIDLYE